MYKKQTCSEVRGHLVENKRITVAQSVELGHRLAYHGQLFQARDTKYGKVGKYRKKNKRGYLVIGSAQGHTAVELDILHTWHEAALIGSRRVRPMEAWMSSPEYRVSRLSSLPSSWL